MKKIILSVFSMVLVSTMLMAQVDTTWKKGAVLSVNFNQVGLTNWAGGGSNTIAGNTILSAFANYQKGKWTWENNGILAYGLTKIDKGDIQKSDDRIDLNSKLGYAIAPKWYLTYMMNFRSQMDNGYDYNTITGIGGDGTPKYLITSKFLAPAFWTNSIGIDYKPNDHFSAYISPVASKITIVAADDKDISHVAYGVEVNKNLRSEFGALAVLKYQQDIMKNIKLQTKLELFSNYIDNPQNVDVNWEVLLAMKVNKYISATLATQLLYDDNIAVPKDDGNKGTYFGKGYQFKEAFGVGFSYNF